MHIRSLDSQVKAKRLPRHLRTRLRIFFLGVVDLVLHKRDLRILEGLDNCLCAYQGCGKLTGTRQVGNVLLV